MRSLTGAVALIIACNAVVSTAGADQRATQRIAGVRIAAIAARAARALPADPDASLVPAFTVPDQSVAAGAIALVPHSAIVTPSYVNVPIEVDVNGTLERTIFVGYRVVRYVHTAVAAVDLAPNTTLTAEDLTIARVPYAGHYANGSAVLVGRRINGAVTAGQPIYIEQTQTDQIIKPGSTVILVIRDTDVSLIATVVARNGGGLGDQIMLFNPATNKTLSGTVVGPNRVELDLEGTTI